MSYGFNGDAPGHYWVDLEWVGPETATLTLQAFREEHDPETELVTQYTGYAQREQRIANGDSVTWSPEFGAMPFRERTIRVRAELGPGESLFQHPIYVRTRSGGGGSMGSGDQESDARSRICPTSRST